MENTSAGPELAAADAAGETAESSQVVSVIAEQRHAGVGMATEGNFQTAKKEPLQQSHRRYFAQQIKN